MKNVVKEIGIAILATIILAIPALNVCSFCLNWHVFFQMSLSVLSIIIWFFVTSLIEYIVEEDE